MEQINLNTAYQPDPRSTTTFRVVRIEMDWEAQRIAIDVTGNSVRRSFLYEGATAATLMASLNTANLSTKSLHRRVLERLVADGKLAGTIDGTPD